MKITGLDFAADLQKLVKERVAGLPGGDRTQFVRFLDFAERSLTLKISWQNTPVGDVAVRVVEEPQDYYMRGAFFPSDGSSPTGFTLRPGKEYDKELTSLVETIAFACVGASFASNPATQAPAPAAPAAAPPAAEPQFFQPGDDFPFAQETPGPASSGEAFSVEAAVAKP